MGNTICVCLESSDNKECDYIIPPSSSGHLLGTEIDNYAYEYQHYTETGWNALALAGRRYSTLDLLVFADSLQGTVAPPPPGFMLDQGWHVVVKRKVRLRDATQGGNIDETGISERYFIF